MRILIFRHGDPDYANDSLTERGKKEALLLKKLIPGYHIDQAYVSPLGRAALTAELALEGLAVPRETCWWLREFAPRIRHPDWGDTIAWDWMPDYWTRDKRFFSLEEWADHESMQEGGVGEEYGKVIGEFDRVIESHGYERDGMIYRAIRSNHDTIAFFCHFGVECVLLSRLINISPMLLWHGFCAAPSAVTSIYTEERQREKVSFRVDEFGAVPHLMMGGMEPSKRARFVECFGDTEPDYEHR